MAEHELDAPRAETPPARVAERPVAASDALDGLVPARVATPSSTAEIESIVRECRRSGAGLVAVGGGTLLGIGNVPQRYDLKLDITALPPTIQPYPDDMVVTVAASLRLSELAARLAEVGQRVTLDAPDSKHATVGGLAAADFAGPLAYRFGTPRDNVVGMTIVDGRGRVLRVGGRVVKNVAGYDLPRLFVGSYGTLGVLTSLTLRTQPRPEHTRRLRIDFDSAAELDAVRAVLFVSKLPLSAIDVAIDHRGDARRWRLSLLAEGTSSEVEFQSERIAALCGARGELTSIADDDADGRVVEGEVVIRFAVKPANGIRLAAELADAASSHDLVGSIDGEAAAARLRWRTAAAGVSQVDAAMAIATDIGARHGASTVVESMPYASKREIDVWGNVPIGLDIMRRLKERFDPDGVLAPGRFVGRM